MSRFSYSGDFTSQISFPLGGIGTGSVGLAGNGRLLDWEIFNKPAKGSVNGFSHFAIRTETASGQIDARVLQGDLPPPYMGDGGVSGMASFGKGPQRAYLSGLPHFRHSTFAGTFPTATLSLSDPQASARVRLTAFNPFIPLNERESSLPAAFFEAEILNQTEEELTCTLAGVLSNPLSGPHDHSEIHAAGATGLHLRGTDPDNNLAISTDAQDTSLQHYWYRGSWFDALEVWWQDLTRSGRLQDRLYVGNGENTEDTAAIAAHFQLPPKGTHTVRFILSWYIPVMQNEWNEDAANWARDSGASLSWRNYYATQWSDATAVALYGFRHFDRLLADTKRFRDLLFESTLPDVVIDAISANLSILKSPTVLRLEDGTFYGWEGLNADAGCCEGSCTHVWGYQQALPFLFPALERSMREADYRYNMQSNGSMSFRMMLPLGTPHQGTRVQRACADGQLGGVIKAYRDWKISGDDDWLRDLWPDIRKSIEFAWHPNNPDRWDPEQSGVLTGRQHHTLDMELFGPNAWLTGFYLGALAAGACMAHHLGEEKTVALYTEILEKGKAWADTHLFNGEYYHQQVDVTDRSLLEPYGNPMENSQQISATYWAEDLGELKYQLGEGCNIDQVLGQWHADLYGLGDLLDREQVNTALASLFRYNFQGVMRDLPNPCRIYSLNDEQGLLICNWPEGRQKPRIPVPYAQETMNGFEYAAASHMIMRGYIEEGLQVVAAVRDRYDGRKRNPWNEIECGSNYARSMSSYALLLVFSGFRFDMGRQHMGFAPVVTSSKPQRFFWCLQSAWGHLELIPNESCSLHVAYGDITLASLGLPGTAGGTWAVASMGSEPVAFELCDNVPHFLEPVQLQRGDVLSFTQQPS